MVVNKGLSADIFIWDALYSDFVCVYVCMYVCITRNGNLNVHVFKVSFHLKHVKRSTVSCSLWVFLYRSVTSHHLQTQ